MDIHVVNAEDANLGTSATPINVDDAEPGDTEYGSATPIDLDDAGPCGTKCGSATDNSSALDKDGVIIEPRIGMEFDTKEAAFSFYEDYAKRVGFSTQAAPVPKRRPGTPITFREFLCIREAPDRKLNNSCAAMLKIELNGPRWVVTRFVKEHNHATISPSKVHYLRSKRHFASSTKNVAAPVTCQAAGEAVPSNGVVCDSVDVNYLPREPNCGVKITGPLELNHQDKNMNPVSVANSLVVYARRPAVSSNGLLYNSVDVNNLHRELNCGVKSTDPLELNSQDKKIIPFSVANSMATYTPRPAVPSNGVLCNSVDANNLHREPNHGVNSANPVVLKHQDKKMNPVSVANSVNHAPRSAVKKRIFGKNAQNMLDYFTKMQADNPGFFYAIQLDGENQVANVFWADARSRTAYGSFGDAVILDTSYRANKYQVPFAPFTGINHHGQTVLFGCALLQDNSEASFLWLFKTFLTAMHDQEPVSIITDHDRAIKVAVSQVFPNARHCINKWDVLREGQDKMIYVGAAFNNFQVELYSCINLTDTIEEFESYWGFIMDKYGLRQNDWLRSLYDTRKQWVPVYFRDSFFAALSPEMGRSNSFFEGYINQNTTLPVFFRQYESAMESWFEREREADFDTLHPSPILRTPSPMEKQAADLYTKTIFAKFQEELVETFVYTANWIDGDSATTSSSYRVAKFEDNRKAYHVTLNDSDDLKAQCSCKMFEYSGILCRHVLTVFTVTNVLTLPSHCILKRWTRDAKSGIISSHELIKDSVPESIALRYNMLCREAIRYAEEGSGAQETYKTALAGLTEGGKKVAIMRRNVAKTASSASLRGASGGTTAVQDNNKKPSADVTPPLLWPRQDEIARQLKLNNGSGIAPNHNATDLNLPRTALQRDNNRTSDGMAILPCFKAMTWVMENKRSSPANRTAIINLKLQNYSKTPIKEEQEIKFKLTAVTLEPMMKSMRQINEQLQAPANRVALINLKLQDKVITPGVSDVKFQVSKDTLTAMLRSMAYIREQLCNPQVEPQADPPPKRSKK